MLIVFLGIFCMIIKILEKDGSKYLIKALIVLRLVGTVLNDQNKF